jgi:3-hydroxy acid dehydrogenase / malonic semialdehyde reductase
MTSTPKLALITGASSGIGRAASRAFARLGTDLLLIGRRQDRLDALKAELSEVDVETWSVDVRDRSALMASAKAHEEALSRVDVLLNNAGLALGKETLQSGDPADWDAMIDTNIKGLLYVTHLVLPAMVKRGLGHIVNIGSVTGRRVYRGGAVYAATKFAVRALNEAMRLDVMGTGVRVTSIDPGMVETEFSLVRFRGDQDAAKKVYDGMRPLAPSDVADAIIWCVTRPPHVNIQEILIMPTDQGGPTDVHRRTG